MFRRSFLFGLAVAAIVAACSTSTTPSSPAPLAVCTAADELDASITALSDLDSQSTLEEVQQAVDRVRTAFEDLRAQGRELAEAGLTQLTEAMQRLDRAVASLPEGTSLEGAINLLREELEALGAARVELRSELGCLGT